MIRCPEFSDDALQAASLWRFNAYLTLSFNTPSKRSPRLIAALDELIEAKIVTMEKVPMAQGHKVVYKLVSRDALNTVPKISDAQMKKNPLPMTVD